MAVSFGSVSTVAVLSGATINITPNAPASIAAGDYLVILLGVKPDTSVNDETVTDWDFLGEFAGGGGTTGIDTGPTLIAAYGKTAVGSDSMPTINITSTNVAWAVVYRYANGTGVWDVAVAGGTDSTTGTAVSVTCGSDPGLTAGDHVVVGFCIPTDVSTPTQFSAEGVAATGVSAWGTFTEDTEPDTNVGNDIGGVTFRGSITTGTSSAAPVITATAGGTTTNVRGPAILVRLREASSGATFTTSAGSALGSGGSSSFTGAATFTTNAAAALANGGSTSFTGGAGFTTTAAAATAQGGSSAFTGDATFGTTVGASAAQGGSSSFSGGAVDGTFTTAAGSALASGGSTTFTGGAGFTTSAASALAQGGSSSFTGNASFTTTAGAATGNGGASTFTGGGSFTTSAASALASGGSSTYTGDATFGSTAGAALAGGGSSSFTGGAGGSGTFTTTAGAAVASGGTSTYSGDAAFTTATATALASGGTSTFTGDASFGSLVGSAVAAGGTGSFTGGAAVTVGDLRGSDAPAAALVATDSAARVLGGADRGPSLTATAAPARTLTATDDGGGHLTST